MTLGWRIIDRNVLWFTWWWLSGGRKHWRHTGSLIVGFIKIWRSNSNRYKIDTYQYTKTCEDGVTKSDIGLILEYQDQFDNKNSFEVYLLFQAKRLFPILNEYEFKSEFNSFNKIRFGLNRFKKCILKMFLLIQKKNLSQNFFSKYCVDIK